VGAIAILERKALVDLEAHLSRSDHIEQLNNSLAEPFSTNSPLFMTESQQFRTFIIFTIILIVAQDSLVLRGRGFRSWLDRGNCSRKLGRSPVSPIVCTGHHPLSPVSFPVKRTVRKETGRPGDDDCLRHTREPVLVQTLIAKAAIERFVSTMSCVFAESAAMFRPKSDVPLVGGRRRPVERNYEAFRNDFAGSAPQ
jgi:hypothetical protein